MTLEIKLPEVPDKTTYTIDGDTITFVRIDHDSDAENPCTAADGVGMIYSASRRHINYKSFDELRDMLGADEDAIALSYYEHGLCKWMVRGGAASRTPGVEFQWDGVEFAGLWVPDDSVRESYTGQDGLSRHDWMVKQAESACELYTQWANGECYHYTVRAYKLRRVQDGSFAGTVYDRMSDYRLDTPLSEDSCAGFYGWDSVIEAVKESLS